MAYIDSRTPRDRAKSVAGVIVVHGAVAYALLVGLQVTGVIEDVPRLTGETVVEVPIEPLPPPKPEVTPENTPTPPTSVHAPQTPLDLTAEMPPIEVRDVPLPPIPEVVPNLFPKPETTPAAQATPAFDPVAPRPRNDPGQWVTTADYRSSWINRELTGVARFRVEVGTDGRVKSCTITGSSGHSELDRATCDLVTRRARFEAGLDGTGAKTAATWSSAVSWQLPD
ncbi:TonB family protein [Pelagerythrobacter aerophilus]|uniref:TonB family protein n=1 Tax=Pelagerythrobacter aerophilus TaxID=2306995 RepID=A0A418NIR3_9SPHN|nr:TonB family protein [Pelagerythrobacter aerophilus]RIV78735.1 TonB family protein [Pelagerythrobacter aerophilus]